MPFITALVLSAIAAAIAQRATKAAFAIVPAAGVLMVAAGFGLYRAPAPVVQGAVFAAVAIGWAAWKRAVGRGLGEVALAAEHSAQTLQSARRRRGIAAAATVAGALAVGVGSFAAASPEATRDVLRNDVVPPLELHNYPSPLQSFRKWVTDYDETALFTVDHLPADARVRLATLDAYDGVVYAVSGDGSATGGTFQRVGSEVATQSQGTAETFDVTIGALDGVWLPTVGELSTLHFGGDNGESLNRALHQNPVTETVVQTYGLTAADTYTFSAILAAPVSPDALAEAEFAALPLPSVNQVPEEASAAAVEAIAGVQGDAQQAAALAEFLSASGFFSHGLEGQAPSRSGHRAERIAELLSIEQMLGDDEQYAVAYALMAHELGIPARVVVGFYPDTYGSGPFEATGSTAHVWAEVAFEDFGWVAIDPSPAEDQAPIDEEESPQREPKPRVLQPPPPPEPPAELPPDIPTEEEVVDEPGLDVETLVRYLIVGATAAGILAVLAGPALAILLAKASRRRKRKRQGATWERMTGGWNEVADLATDYKVAVPTHVTRAEGAHLVREGFAGVAAVSLAATADRGVWAPGEPSEAEVDAYWTDVVATLTAMHKSRSARERLAARLSLRSIAARRAELRDAVRLERRLR